MIGNDHPGDSASAQERTKLFESALDGLYEGIALFDRNGDVAFWNQAAEAITGYAGEELLERALPHGLAILANGSHGEWNNQRGAEVLPSHRVLLKLRHKLGHPVEIMSRTMMLFDGLGERIGSGAVFHSAESLDALPHGVAESDVSTSEGQAELEERLRSEFEDFEQGGPPLGVVWITVDQAERLRRSHGPAACEVMLGKLESALRTALRASEVIGRWGEDEFLVIAHEPSPERLAAHARLLAGMARTANFTWWGDRISLTVSVGAAQASKGEGIELAELLRRAQKAMETSLRAGGNLVTVAPEGHSCLPS